MIDDYEDDDACEICGKGQYDCNCFHPDECGRMPGGGCLKAGTEECDFECPYND